MKTKILIMPNIENNININKKYVKAIEMSNGIPILATYTSLENVEEYIDFCDGILLSGGGDVNSEILKIEKNKLNDNVPLIRDEFEIEIIKRAIEKDIPMLCICRGIQILNVACGGTLVQHINGHSGNKIDYHHKIIIKKESRLFESVQDVVLDVNSAHHQVIAKLGENLMINAFSNDGYIEGIESTKNKYILGVQWHPEYLIEKSERNLNIFKEFIKHCK